MFFTWERPFIFNFEKGAGISRKSIRKRINHGIGIHKLSIGLICFLYRFKYVRYIVGQKIFVWQHRQIYGHVAVPHRHKT